MLARHEFASTWVVRVYVVGCDWPPCSRDPRDLRRCLVSERERFPGGDAESGGQLAVGRAGHGECVRVCACVRVSELW